MRKALSELNGDSFDVAIIGGGVNGASAAQHLAAAGYTTLLIERGDFGSGASSRSTRLLHCGLRYLAPGGSLLDFVRYPSRAFVARRMAKLAMEARRQFVQTAPERVQQLQFHFPIWRGGQYRPWQVRLALRLLASLAPGDVPLENRVLSPTEAKRVPLVAGLRDWDKLEAVAAFREYQFDWPERICLDAVLEAEQMGASVRNYTTASGLSRDRESWRITLSEAVSGQESPATATVRARVVLNTAGIWIDQVNQMANAAVGRKILGTKGVHIMVHLPPDCAGTGIATLNRVNEGLYCVPWRGMHYFGPTETVYDGNIDAIRPEEDEIEFLRAEANHLLPGLNLKRDDILFAWAGVRPLTWDPALPKGKRSREVHDLAAEGLPGVFALTGGPIMTHRSAGAELTEVVARRLKPSRPAQPISYAPRRFPENQNSPALLDDFPAIKLADLKYAAENEHVLNLVDLLFRRVGAGWTRSMAAGTAGRAAETVAGILGWDETRIAAEIAAYRAYLEDQHAKRLHSSGNSRS
ncbi:MAG TPA: FAD-dependent oxidoreductase [Stellaceae bacterium]|nr:FAD-dependent oxidoreductase [Stellaceae bacterium]